MFNFFKRFCDVTISLIALIVLSPLLLILSILTLIFNGAPVIFKQPRPGKDGKIFMLYKFRSMSNKKDANGNLLPDSKRITKFGKFIRKTSLDELPQLVNIIKGDMSIVGPRPRLVKDVIFYSPNVRSLKVRPGITGLSQVNGRNNNTWESNFIYDALYVQKKSLGLDTKIFFKTFEVVLKQTGANSGETDIQDYYYGDYLLRVGKITQEEYNEKMQKAKRICEEFVASKKFRKHFSMKGQEVEDFDFEHKLID
ncbi:MAG: sugar transferase [Clostridia bacterium]|nr:sugar transferase [Clostridia bacterium]